jgi:osmotically-inducible protein OsmY
MKLLPLGLSCALALAACDRPASNTETTSGTPTNAAQRPPDNTTVNDRDRGMDATTPMTQGNAPSEVDITANVRRAIMADDTLGFDAKNVKIITVGTKVTLRGPVATGREKAAIAAHAHVAGVTEVDDQLEIEK